MDQIPSEEGIIIESKPNVINQRKYYSNKSRKSINLVQNNLFSISLSEYDHVQLSDLEIIGTLGVGGFGRVELVQYKKKDTFALKILKKCEVASQGQIEHAYSEKDIMSTCDSSFIVK